MTDSNVANVLALVTELHSGFAETEAPTPPIGSSDGAQALWYALLGDYEFNVAEMAVLEQVINTKTHLDEVEDDWRADGSPKTAKGSMGQPVADPRIQEARQLRGQFAALIKQLAIPSDDSASPPGAKRRPGRPTRAASGGGSWGAS